MPSAPEDFELKLELLAEYQAEYRDLADNWRSLETKAQGAMAVAGIFVGGAIALVQRLSAYSSSASLIAIGVAALVLLSSIVCALNALRIRDVSAPPDGEAMRGLVNDVIAFGNEERAARYLGLLDNRIAAWHDGNNEVAKWNDATAGSLWYAQRLIGVAILAFATVVIAEVFRAL